MPNFFYVCYDRDDINLSNMGGVWVNDTYGWRFNMSDLKRVSEYLNSIVIDDDETEDDDDNEEEHKEHRPKRRSGLHRECSFEIDFMDD
jgi:hypothetical protein